MASFKRFVEEQEFVEFVLNEFNAPGQRQMPGMKPWSAKKPEIMQMWQNLRPDMPILMTPMVGSGLGGTSSYGEDGIRVTGSWQFISSVIGRFKDIMNYENPTTKLRLVFKGVDKSRGRADRESFVFYVNADPRASGKTGKPKLEKPKKVKPLKGIS